MRSLFFIALSLVAAANLAADTYPRQTGVDALHYVFRLSLMPGGPPEITGETTVTVRATSPETREVVLDLASSSGGKGMTVTRVASGAAEWKFAHAADRLTVTFPEPARAGDQRTFTVSYRGTPASGLNFANNIHGEPTIFSENWPNLARQWLPTIDHPYDKATGEFIVTTGSGFQVVGNGVLVAETDLSDGRRETHWKQSVPIASWLYALGIARFTSHHAGEVRGIPLQTWVFPQDRKAGETLFEDLSRRAMAYFIDRVGPYSYEKLANVQAAGVNGGMEHATVIFYGEKGVASGEGPVVHEIAHQWFGNSVTERDWDDVWLSEGFATYFTLLFTEHDRGRDAFVEGVRRSRDSVLRVEAKLPDTPVIHRNLADMSRVLNQLVYQKGGWVLHMLRHQIGTDAFWRGIQDYYRKYQNQNASTDDLRACMEAASGQDLKWFFDQWLRRPGMPRLDGEWRYDAARKQVEVTLTQAQKSDPFRLSVEVGVTNAKGAVEVHKLPMDGRTTRLTISAAAAPTNVVLDPNVWLLYDAGTFMRSKRTP